MYKKLFVLGGGAALLLGLVCGRSHIQTTVGMVKQQVRESVPIDFEIKRARQMIKDLHPEIEKNLRLIAQEEVEVAKLESDVNRSEDRLDNDRSDILRLTGALESGKNTFVFARHTYSAREVQADLKSRFEEFKTQAATMDSLQKTLAARQVSLQAARDKLDGMLDSKRQLEVDVENLEARLAMVEVAQTTSSYNFDDSQLARTREMIDDIGTRIDVAEKLVKADGLHFDRIILDEPEVDADISDEITKYFGEDRIAIESYVNNVNN
jgi:chromosome segregation ATPase